MEPDKMKLIEQQLWRLFPEVYRNRDKGDLEKFLSSCSGLLGQIYATLERRYQDAFPETCQTWLIPYFAQLLDVRLVSPEINGQRREVAQGVAWRQRKGTAGCVEQIAQDVGQMEVELQEGWQRVATTFRIDMPLLPVDALGQKKTPDMDNPLEALKHPGLETAFVDFRYASRAVQTDTETAVSRETRFGADTVLWRQTKPGGTPCFPGHYEDVSKRTVDLRDPNWVKGHYHPKRVLLFMPPPFGFFRPDQQSIDWLDRKTNPNAYEEMEDLAEDSEFFENGAHIRQTRRVYRNPAYAELFEEVEEVQEFADGRVKIRRIFQGRNPDSPLEIRGAIAFMAAPPPDQERVYCFRDIYLRDTITVKYDRLDLERVAAFRTWVQNADKSRPVLTAKDSLIQDIRVAKGLCQLEYCTVLGNMVIEKLQASDCILMEKFARDLTDMPLSELVCVRYSAVPRGLGRVPGMYNCTEKPPIFYANSFGRPGCGVLMPSTPAPLRLGSEDGGEMGAFHHRHFSLRTIAVAGKLADFLPIGIEPVIIPDERLWVTPP